MDSHTDTAAKMFGVPPEKVTPTQRGLAKMVTFGETYGTLPRDPLKLFPVQPLPPRPNFTKFDFSEIEKKALLQMLAPVLAQRRIGRSSSNPLLARLIKDMKPHID